MKLYQSNGYANMRGIINESETPFIMVIGGRGVGKTYNAIRTLLEDEQLFIYLRRTSAQMELVSKDEFSPIVKIGRDLGMNLCTEMLSKYAAGVYHCGEDGKAAGDPVAVIMALSTIANARSFDASSVKVILYDECIPERHERSITHEEDAFLNMYESIDRNRQLNGDPPVRCVCLANANNMEAPILRALSCIRLLDRMRKKKQTQLVDKTIGLSIYLLNDSPISAEKRRTALYKLTMGKGDFSDMALDNAFGADNYTDISVRPLSEYVPYASVGSICLYRHKNSYNWYVSETISGKPKQFENTITDRARFRLYCQQSWKDYFERRLCFENVNAKVFYKCVMTDTLK